MHNEWMNKHKVFTIIIQLSGKSCWVRSLLFLSNIHEDSLPVILHLAQDETDVNMRDKYGLHPLHYILTGYNGVPEWTTALSMIYYRSKSFHQNVDNKPMKIILDCENIHKAKYEMSLGIFRVLFVIGFSFGAALCKPLIGWVWNSTVNFTPFSTWT